MAHQNNANKKRYITVIILAWLCPFMLVSGAIETYFSTSDIHGEKWSLSDIIIGAVILAFVCFAAVGISIRKVRWLQAIRVLCLGLLALGPLIAIFYLLLGFYFDIYVEGWVSGSATVLFLGFWYLTLVKKTMANLAGDN